MIFFISKLLFFILGSILMPRIFWVFFILFFDYFFAKRDFAFDLLFFGFLSDLFSITPIGFSLIVLSILFLILSFLNRFIFFEGLKQKLLISALIVFAYLVMLFIFQLSLSWYNIFLSFLLTILGLTLLFVMAQFIHGRVTIFYW